MAKDKQSKPEPGEQAPRDTAPITSRVRTRTVREWSEARGERRAVVAGAGALAGWTADTALTEAEFAAGLQAYCERPLGGPSTAPRSKTITIRPEGRQ